MAIFNTFLAGLMIIGQQKPEVEKMGKSLLSLLVTWQAFLYSGKKKLELMIYIIAPVIL